MENTDLTISERWQWGPISELRTLSFVSIRVKRDRSFSMSLPVF
jgi:hypothetical protein